MDKLYTCSEVAQRYGVACATVYDWIRRKSLPAIRLDKGFRITQTDLELFDAARRTSAQTHTEGDRHG